MFRVTDIRGWHGPAICVAPGGPTSWWLKHRGRLFRVPLELMRDATTEEIVALHECQATDQWEVQVALTRCAQARNRLARRAGFSPAQAVMGFDTRIPQSLVDEPCNVVAHQTWSVSAALRKREQMRDAAVRAFVFLDSDARVRRCLLAPGRPSHVTHLVPGSQVMFWNAQQRNMTSSKVTKKSTF